MLTNLNGTLWPTLEAPGRGIEIARCGWGTPDALAAAQTGEIPALWLCNPNAGGCPAVAQRLFVSKGTVEPIFYEGQLVGSRFEDDQAEFVMLAGVGPSDPTAPRANQAASAFENIESILKKQGFTFHDVVRTWLYMDKLLEWYDELNRVRDAFFESHGIFGGFVPASTGIGSANVTGSAIITAAIAMRPKLGSTVTRAMLESPLQCSALDYRSSFSRAAEIVTPEGCIVFISGTASIAYGGETAYVGDPEKQIALTMEVVKAILGTRQMGLQHATRAIAYIKRPEYRPIWQKWLAENGLPADFAQEIIADVCRDDLLFELELDAFKRL